MRGRKRWHWHLDEVFVKINGVTHYLWRAVDHEGEVLESVVTKPGSQCGIEFTQEIDETLWQT
jgi:transposase-like protein